LFSKIVSVIIFKSEYNVVALGTRLHNAAPLPANIQRQRRALTRTSDALVFEIPT